MNFKLYIIINWEGKREREKENENERIIGWKYFTASTPPPSARPSPPSGCRSPAWPPPWPGSRSEPWWCSPCRSQHFSSWRWSHSPSNIFEIISQALLLSPHPCSPPSPSPCRSSRRTPRKWQQICDQDWGFLHLANRRSLAALVLSRWRRLL